MNAVEEDFRVHRCSSTYPPQPCPDYPVQADSQRAYICHSKHLNSVNPNASTITPSPLYFNSNLVANLTIV
jgi:hypothetical protein